MEDEKIKKVAFYIRVSTEEQAQDDKFGKKNQLEALNALLITKKGSLVFAGDQHVYIDDVSGTVDIEERPAFRKLMEDITYAPADDKPFDVLAVYKIDRFARKLRILLNTIDWMEDKGLEFISVHESIDTSSPFGKAMLGIIGVISELEIENIKLRTHGGRLVAGKEGKYLGRIPPFGYTKDSSGKLTICSPEAPHLKLIFNLFTKQGYTTQQIANHLKLNKIPSPESSAIINNKTEIKKLSKKYDIYFWQERTVRRILSEEIYTGDYYYNKTRTVKGKQTDLPRDQWKLSDYHHQALIDPFQFQQAKEILDDAARNHKNYGVNSDHTYLLTGILKCAACYDHAIDNEPQSWIGNRKEIEKGKGKFTYHYMCRRKSSKNGSIPCNTIPLPGKEVEEYVTSFITKLLQNPVDTFNYYKELESSKAQRNQYESKLRDINKLISSYDNTKSILLEQNTRGLIGMDKLEELINNLNDAHKRHLQERDDLNTHLAPLIVSDGYNEVFEAFKKYYSDNLNEILLDRPKLQNLFRLLIKEIIVSSRQVETTDVIAGKKKANQLIPNKLLIKLRLPKEILRGLVRDEYSNSSEMGGDGLISSLSSLQSDTFGARGQT